MDVLTFPSRMRHSFDGSDSHLVVKGLPPSINEQSLFEIFSKFGEIQSCRLVPTSSPTNQAIVNLSSPLQAKEAITALHGAPTDRGVLEVVSGSASAGKVSCAPKSPLTSLRAVSLHHHGLQALSLPVPALFAKLPVAGCYSYIGKSQLREVYIVSVLGFAEIFQISAGRSQAPCDNVYVRQMPATWTEQVQLRL